MKRLYWNEILSRTVMPYNDVYRFQIVVGRKMYYHDVQSLGELYDALKADGFQI